VIFGAQVLVRLKDGIADPQGQTIAKALPALGFSEVTGVRVGKLIELQVEAPDELEARRRVAEMCRRLLANPVIEVFEVGLT
jgi:phosphoribosylformylglycinamidine synthase